MWDSFLLTFVPFFIAVDPIGVLPMFIGITESLDKNRLRKVIFQSIGTGIVVALAFLFLGHWILKFLGISIADFMIAGGILLFIIAMTDLFTTDKKQRHIDPESIGAVPIGVPLIVGPGVFTTSLLLVEKYGFFMTALGMISNLVLTGLVFLFAPFFIRILGKTGSQVVSKLALLLLAAIAVMIIREGVVATILAHR